MYLICVLLIVTVLPIAFFSEEALQTIFEKCVFPSFNGPSKNSPVTNIILQFDTKNPLLKTYKYQVLA